MTANAKLFMRKRKRSHAWDVNSKGDDRQGEGIEREVQFVWHC